VCIEQVYRWTAQTAQIPVASHQVNRLLDWFEAHPSPGLAAVT